jgi:cytochrome c peroxidase
VGRHHRAIRRPLALLAGLLVACGASAQQPAALTEAEVAAILSLGPWPVPMRPDPGNAVSGKREAVEFGERLFFDNRMSGNGKFSCGSCHVPERNWTDNRTRAFAIAEADRNTPTLMNVRLGRSFGWDGAADSLWAQSKRPILDPRELGSSARQVAELVRKDEQMSCRYRKTFGAPPSASDDEAVFTDVAKALAAFQETFETPPTPFDAFRDTLARKEPLRPWTYSEAALRGVRIFVGKGGCANCHSGPNLTSGGFHDNGFSLYAAAGRPDPGRNGTFKVPTLRHLFLTAPYGHHGELGSLKDVVQHYSERGSAEIKPLKLTAAEQSDLVVFLESLSTFNNPWRPDDLNRCL